MSLRGPVSERATLSIPESVTSGTSGTPGLELAGSGLPRGRHMIIVLSRGLAVTIGEG